MTVSRLAAVALSFCLPAGASGQDPGFLSRLDAETRAAVLPTVQAAAGDSLPTGALQSKVLEGMAKAVAPAQIAQVVQTLADELRSARGALRAELPDVSLSDGEIVATASAARQGIGYDVVVSLWDLRGDGRSLEIPVTILSELVRRGVPVEEAATVVGHVVRTSVPLHVAAQIPGKFDGALGAGSPPAGALAEALRMLDIPTPPPTSGRGSIR
ncbi:MAG TPA: hypothetical protein VML54_15125 [Candidatus Limnocylindrales bacterium]|nr:hypothetical protein [Candidatus Limnocylindrales bacterium]